MFYILTREHILKFPKKTQRVELSIFDDEVNNDLD